MKNKIILNNVTLACVSSIKIKESLLALEFSKLNIEYHEVLFLSSEAIQVSNKINLVKIPKINNLIDYSKFILLELFKHIKTDYVLLIQHDGFVLNADSWNPSYLDYDYIGAPWPNKLIIQGEYKMGLDLSKNLVGNGGFSIRSKKLLQETSKFNLDNINFPIIEDLLIGYYFFETLIKLGIKFPTAKLAASFSIETEEAAYGHNLNNTFGFHGDELKKIIYDSIN
jgi:hypothetical protein